MKLALFRERVIPDFIIEDHSRFVEFVSMIMSWISEPGSPYYHLDNLASFTNVNEAVGIFYQLLRDEYSIDFPSNLVTETSLFLENLINIYRSKGTEKAYDYFFRIVYGVSINIKYPKDNILKTSDGIWNQSIVMNYSGLNFTDLHLIRTSYIMGLSSQAIGHIRGVKQVNPPEPVIWEFNAGNIKGNEFYIDSTNYHVDGYLIAQNVKEESYVIINPILDSKIYSIQNDSFYNVDVFIDGFESKGIRVYSGTKVWFKKIDNVTNEIIIVDEPEIQIDNNSLYQLTLEIIQGNFSFGEPVKITSGPAEIVGKIFTCESIEYSDGLWENTQGQLNSDMLIQDSYYYQLYSYVIQTRIKPSIYFKSLKKLLHPAGLMVFTEYVQGAWNEEDFLDIPDPLALCLHYHWIKILHFIDAFVHISWTKTILEIRHYVNQYISAFSKSYKSSIIKLYPIVSIEESLKYKLESFKQIVLNPVSLEVKPFQRTSNSLATAKKQSFLWDRMFTNEDYWTSENFIDIPVNTIEMNHEISTNLVFGGNSFEIEFARDYMNNSGKNISGDYYNYKINSWKAIQEYDAIETSKSLPEEIEYGYITDEVDLTENYGLITESADIFDEYGFVQRTHIIATLFTWDESDGYTNLDMDNFVAFTDSGKFLKKSMFTFDLPNRYILYKGPYTKKIYFCFFDHEIISENTKFKPFLIYDNEQKRLWLESSIIFFDQEGNFIPANFYLKSTQSGNKILKLKNEIDLNLDIISIPKSQVQKFRYTEIENVDYGKILEDIDELNDDYGRNLLEDVIFIEDYTGKILEDKELSYIPLLWEKYDYQPISYFEQFSNT